ncbi:MAG: glycosyltransferase family 9 protein [Planctomycetota bacterium]
MDTPDRVSPASPQTNRLLVVLPSWVGDAVMATPALRKLRSTMPGAYIGALARPGIDAILDGLADDSGRPVFDEWHVERPTGVLGPKLVASKLKPRRYGSALLLTNSFSTALIARVAGIPRRVGYDRDGRGILLTQRLRAPKRSDQGLQGPGWAVVPAVSYYWHAALAYLDPDTPPLTPPALDNVARVTIDLPGDERMALAVTERDRADAEATLASAGLEPDAPLAILNPGGNNHAKRWPADRFAAIADHLRDRGLTVLINGSPAEAELCREIAQRAESDPVVLPDHQGTLRGLKSLCQRARLMVTNDTGPRHIAIALNTPTVSLFGPTDARWTTVPVHTSLDGPGREVVLVADPDLERTELANDHPDRCSVDRITTQRVLEAIAQLGI